MTSPQVTINDCLIQGKYQPSSTNFPRPVEIFYSIPYAKADRFQPATLLPPTPNTTIKGLKPGPTAPIPFSQHETAESPLYLNVFRPVPSQGTSDSDHPSGENRLLPVVIYIHGGGFNFGYPLDNSSESFIAWGESDVIVVSIGYRLGPLGFLAGGLEAKELNLGLRDQRVAVEWVREYISGFGGDKERICFRGVSAGAHSIGHHLLNPSSQGITKAILESGSPTARMVLSPSHPRVVDQLRSMTAKGRNAPLKTMGVDALLNASVEMFTEHSLSLTWPNQPVIDGPGGTIADLPLNLWDSLLSSGKAKDLSVITGFCSFEGASFVPMRMRTTFRDFFAKLIPSFSAQDLDALEKLYPDPATNTDSIYNSKPGLMDNNDMKSWARLYDAYGHYAYICPVLHTAHILASGGATVHLYEYAVKSLPHKLAGHSTQNPAVEHNISELEGGIGGRHSQYRPGLRKIAKEMNERWVKFVSSDEGLDEEMWPKFDAGGEDLLEKSGKILVFGDGNDEDCKGTNQGVAVKERVLTEREKEVCRFWWERMELSQGMGERGVAKRKF